MVAAAATSLMLVAAPAQAGLTLERNQATVVSVDGPRDLTVRRAGENVRVRIDNIDAPLGATKGRRAECGADRAMASLRYLAPRGKRLSVFSYGLKDGGRSLVDAQDLAEVKKNGTDEGPVDWFSDSLIARGVARPGLARGLTQKGKPSSDLIELEYRPSAGEGFYAGDPVVQARRGVGVWGACNGRFHLPGRQQRPPVKPAQWTITAVGRTTAVGSLQLFPTDAKPTAVTTFADVAKAFPDLEVVRSYTGLCVGTSGARALRFQSDYSPRYVRTPQRGSCAAATVRSITSLGNSGTTLGPAVGGRLSALRASFPAVLVDARSRYGELDGQPTPEDSNGLDATSPTVWRTAAILNGGPAVSGFLARLPLR